MPAADGVTADFRCAVPGSRSITARALVCAALAYGTSALAGVADCDDADAIEGCLRGLGIRLDRDGSTTTVTGGALAAGASTVLDCNASGTTLRFIAGLSLLVDEPMVLTGTARLLSRPMGPLLATLESLGKTVQVASDRIVLSGAPALTDVIRIDASSSGQFVSGLLMAAAASGRTVTIDAIAPASVSFIRMTVTVMRAFGAEVQETETDEGLRFVLSGSGYSATAFTVEPDVMSANYFLAAALLVDRPVRVDGLPRDTIQGDVALLDTLEAMGAVVEWDAGGVRAARKTGDGIRGTTVDIRDMPDMCLTIAALAAVADSPTTMLGTAILRHKESDRLAVIVDELGKLGVRTTVGSDDDSITIEPVARLTPAAIATHEDHRVAMAFGLLTLLEPAIEILDPQCVAKTWPTFFDELGRFAATVPALRA